MPRKRTSTVPPKERAKIDTPEDINRELKKLYRLHANKQITATELKSRRETLVALRAGMPDPIEHPKAPAVSALCITTIAEGQQYAPGNEVLMPFELAAEVWRAHNAGKEAWQAYLSAIEGQLTLKAFQSLSRVPALERKALQEEPALRLVSLEGGDNVA